MRCPFLRLKKESSQTITVDSTEYGLLLKQNQQLREDKEKMGAEIERLKGSRIIGHGIGQSKTDWVEPVWWQL